MTTDTGMRGGKLVEVRLGKQGYFIKGFQQELCFGGRLMPAAADTWTG